MLVFLAFSGSYTNKCEAEASDCVSLASSSGLAVGTRGINPGPDPDVSCGVVKDQPPKIEEAAADPMLGARSREDLRRRSSPADLRVRYFSGCRTGRHSSEQAGNLRHGWESCTEGSRAWHETGSGPDYRAPQTGDSKIWAQPRHCEPLGGLKTEERLIPVYLGEDFTDCRVWETQNSAQEQWRGYGAGLTQEQVGKLTTCGRR